MSFFRPALLVIDMQNDFCHPEKGALPCTNGALHLAAAINELLNLKGWAIKIATVCSAPDNWKMNRENHSHGKTHIDLPNHKNANQTHKQPLWPPLGKKGTHGHEIIAEIEKDKIDLVVEKNQHADVMMYSGFGDSHGNKKHDLPKGAVSHHIDEELRAKGVTHVYMVGTAGDYCVPHTAWDSVHFGFKTYILEDVIANIHEDGVQFEECKKKSQGMGIEYITRDNWQVTMVRNL